MGAVGSHAITLWRKAISASPRRPGLRQCGRTNAALERQVSLRRQEVVSRQPNGYHFFLETECLSLFQKTKRKISADGQSRTRDVKQQWQGVWLCPRPTPEALAPRCSRPAPALIPGVNSARLCGESEIDYVVPNKNRSFASHPGLHAHDRARGQRGSNPNHYEQ